MEHRLTKSPNWLLLIFERLTTSGEQARGLPHSLFQSVIPRRTWIVKFTEISSSKSIGASPHLAGWNCHWRTAVSTDASKYWPPV
jgi:hypothetical protein